ncbi:MAG: A24 family peptidase [Phycisphaerales bacterium]|nr:A24 family peptidase [Phycisphaerales bacterium]
MKYGSLMTAFAAIQIAFAFAFGSCVGSLINVLVYRMPLGLSVVRPASRCPKCGHLLSWRENIPVLGWLLLRGRCRFCKSPISPEYPIVEAFVGLVFVAFYTIWYIVPNYGAHWLGFDWSILKPEWAQNGFVLTWPVFITLIVLVSSLIAMTIIDARTFTIPLALTWTPALLALVAHPAWALAMHIMGKKWRPNTLAPGEWWALPTPGPMGWPLLCAAIGGVLGLGVANLLLALGLIRRSFADYDEWESKALADAGLPPRTEPDPQTPRASGPTPNPDPVPNPIPNPIPETPTPAAADVGIEPRPAALPSAPKVRPKAGIVLGIAAAIAGLVAGALTALACGYSPVGGAVLGALIAIPAIGPLAGRPARAAEASRAAPGDQTASHTTHPGESPAEFWIQYPFARREVAKELLFLAPCIALAILGWFLGERIGAPWTTNPMTGSAIAASAIPLWLSVLGGVCLGYLAGGGIVWGIRIFGTFGFGKEAMGLGDVHLLAAVGACCGWIDAVLAFFLAPFIALYVVLVQAMWTGGGRRAMPYGPYLAGATIAVLLGKVGIEQALTHLFGSPIPLNFP